MGLEDLRKEVDRVDYQLLQLLARRFRINKRVAAFKRKQGLAIKDAKRESKILKDRATRGSKLKIEKHFTEQLFQKIMVNGRKQ